MTTEPSTKPSAALRAAVRLAVASLLILAPASQAAETTWRIDPGPSSVRFKVRHLIFSQVEGRFEKFSGEVAIPREDFANARISTTIEAGSVYTRHPDRDRELAGEDFFWAGRYPEIRFESTEVVPSGESTYEIAGELTIRGVTRPIRLQAQYEGTRDISRGRERADFRATGSLNRFDYGLEWNAVAETGGVLVGETVEIVLDVALVREVPAPGR